MNKVSVEMDVRTAAAVRQILYEHQKGYTTNPVSVPPRIFDIREVITDLDNAIGKVVETL